MVLSDRKPLSELMPYGITRPEWIDVTPADNLKMQGARASGMEMVLFPWEIVGIALWSFKDQC